MGATDGQISRLFERRSAFDGLLGGLMALAAAFLVLAALQARVIATGSGLLGSVGMPAHVWPDLAAHPAPPALLAAVSEWLTVFRRSDERRVGEWLLCTVRSPCSRYFYKNPKTCSFTSCIIRFSIHK